jgi:hypothetical protein
MSFRMLFPLWKELQAQPRLTDKIEAWSGAYGIECLKIGNLFLGLFE